MAELLFPGGLAVSWDSNVPMCRFVLYEILGAQTMMYWALPDSLDSKPKTLNPKSSIFGCDPVILATLLRVLHRQQRGNCAVGALGPRSGLQIF